MNKSNIVSGNLFQFSAATKAEGNSWHYEYIKIDEKRFDNVYVANYINDDFQYCIGKEITLSMVPVPKKNSSGMIVAFRQGNKVERTPELKAGTAWFITLVGIGKLAPAIAVVGAIVWFFLFFAFAFVLSLIFRVFGADPYGNTMMSTAATCSALFLVSFFIHKTFISKGSIIGSREQFNAATRALD